MPKLNYYSNCVNWKSSDVSVEGGLSDMVSAAREVTRKTFLRHVDRRDREHLEYSLGYRPRDPRVKPTISKDWDVSYCRSKLHGKTVYFMVHSAIEYVFRERNSTDRGISAMQFQPDEPDYLAAA